MFDNTQQNSLHSLEENTSLFADDTMTPCDLNITNQHSVIENTNDTNIPCALKHHIAQHIQDLSDNTQQNSLHSLEENTSLFADDTMTPCDLNITNQHSVIENTNDISIPCAPKHNIAQHIQDLSDNTHQNSLHSLEENTSLFADDTMTPCDLSITNQHSVIENTNDTNITCAPKQSGIHSQCKHKYRNTFGESNIQYHNFDNQDSLTFTDKYTALLQQELQNLYWKFT